MEHSTNPFIVNSKKGVKLTYVLNSNQEGFTSTGEELDLVLASKKEIDKTPFTKVYNNDFDFLLRLSKGTIKLFAYISKHLVKFNSDEVYLWYPALEGDKYTMTESSFYKAIKQLCKEGILAKANRPQIYFINPNIFFQGERRYLLIK